MLNLFVNRNIRRERIDDLIGKKDNLLFLDYDGVVNTNGDCDRICNFDKKCIKNLNRFCKKFHFRIVVSSSWKNFYNYKAVLYDSGLDKNIIIDGKTEDLKNKEDAIQKYVNQHPSLGCFIIVDDEDMPKLTEHLIKTEFSCGFNRQKYKEAVELFFNIKKKNR